MTAESGDPSEIVTIWVGRYIPSAGGLEWANGGRPRPGQARERRVRATRDDGAAAWSDRGGRYEQESVALEAGDEILLYTDGVTEARRGNVLFGEERVKESFERSTDTLDAARDLLESVRGYVEAELRDDIAILVLGVRSRRPEDGTE